MRLEDLLKLALDKKASDIFLIAGLPITLQISGVQNRIEQTLLMPQETESLVREIYNMAERPMADFVAAKNHDDDFSFAARGLGRFRVNVFRQRGSIAAVIRVIPFVLPNVADLHIPETVMNLTKLQKGLVLVTGPAGSGKSTTLACMVDKLNHERSGHIITMEDPIEYVHKHNTCIVTQREIPTDVATYEEALKSAMRESPNVMLLGEMRDKETIETAVIASEMAQLLFSTLHTVGAANSVDRIVDCFPASQQYNIRLQLSIVLQAVVSQRLVPSIDGGMVPAFEIMLANTAIRNLIRDEKTHQIDSVIAANGKNGMITMDQSLFNLFKEGKITQEVALEYSVHSEALSHKLKATKLSQE